MSEIKLTEANFYDEVINSDKPVLVDFWATWCGPCKMIEPVVAQIADEYEGKIKVGKVNVDEEMQLALKYKVASIPTLILFKNGDPAAVKVGYCDKSELEAFIGQA